MIPESWVEFPIENLFLKIQQTVMHWSVCSSSTMCSMGAPRKLREANVYCGVETSIPGLIWIQDIVYMRFFPSEMDF